MPLMETNKFIPAIDELTYSYEPKVKALTIKIAGPSSFGTAEKSFPVSPSISLSPHLNSPSPPSSAFASALQSPYISPRASEPPPRPRDKIRTPSPSSYSYTHSEDVPSTSYTPPSESYDFPIGIIDHKPNKFSDAMTAPRISFSFPVPRISLTKGSLPASSSAKLRNCDVYIAFHGQNLNLIRFCKWLKSELELQGIASFVADRAKYSDTQSHEIADRIICSASFGVVVVTPSSFLNHLSIDEIRFFAQKKNLIPVLFDTELSELMNLFDERLEDKDCREAFEGLIRCNEYRMDANDTNWRSCISKVVDILTSKLGRRSITLKEFRGGFKELPFARNRHFVGREKELTEIEAAFFGCCDFHEVECPKAASANASSSDGFADEESDRVRANGRYISLDFRKCKEPTLEAWIEPMFELATKARSLQKQRSKHKKPRSAGNKGHNCAGHVFCISGASGVGKTELALEFAYRYSQRYKMVLWVSGDARYFRQNILNLSLNLGVDVSAETEKERGRIRSFDEQELDAYQRIKRELFREIPYLLVIDNLETEKEWWEGGKDLHDLIPRNTGATHVIITTRLPKVMNFEMLRLQEVTPAESVLMMKGARKKDYTSEDHNVLKKFDERLGRLSFGLSVVGSILSELAISPSELFEAIENISPDDGDFSLGGVEDGFFHSHPYLMKVLVFCFALLDRAKGRDLASRMALCGGWFASAPVASNLLAAAADNIPSKGSGFQRWGKGLINAFFCGYKCCVAPQAQKNEVEAALRLVKLGLAKRSTKQPGLWIQFHPITQLFSRRRGGLMSAKATIDAVRKNGNGATNSEHLWASAFLVFGFKSEPPLMRLNEADMVQFIRRTAIPLAIQSFMMFSRCNAALELLRACTNVLEEVEKSFVSQIQDWHSGPLCWRKQPQSNKLDEYVWQDVTLLKAALLETRAKLLLRGGCFDSGEELCRTCISIRTVMLGHNHAQTLAAQETLAKLVRCRSKI